MSYDRTARFAPASTFDVVLLDPVQVAAVIKAASPSCNRNNITVTMEYPTLTSPARIVIDLTTVESIGMSELSVLSRVHSMQFRLPTNAATVNCSTGQMTYNLEVPVGSCPGTLVAQYDVATAEPV